MVDYGLKISKRGSSVLSVNKNDLAYNSSNNYVYIFQQGSLRPASQTITHGLNFYPMIEAWGKDNSNHFWKAYLGDPNSVLKVFYYLISTNEIGFSEGGGDSGNELYYVILSTSVSYV